MENSLELDAPVRTKEQAALDIAIAALKEIVYSPVHGTWRQKSEEALHKIEILLGKELN